MPSFLRKWASALTPPNGIEEPPANEVEAGHDLQDPPNNEWDNWWQNRIDVALGEIQESGEMLWQADITYRRPVVVREGTNRYELQTSTSTNQQPSLNPGAWINLGFNAHMSQNAVLGLVSALAARAPLASPSLSGNPTAPTQSPGNNSQRLATTAFVTAAINAIVSAAPGALDTLNELADALGNDPNFATTMTNALAGKSNVGHTHTVADIVDIQTNFSFDSVAPWHIAFPNWMGNFCIQGVYVANHGDNTNINYSWPIAFSSLLGVFTQTLRDTSNAHISHVRQATENIVNIRHHDLTSGQSSGVWLFGFGTL